MEQFLQEIFDDSFHNAYECYQLRKQTEPGFTRAFLQGLLNSLYAAQGDDWLGRGEVKDASDNGVIAAAEAILSEWQDEPETRDGCGLCQ
ncbi:MAG TPA: hypothetical protein PLP25_00850 [Candidatus Limiplasma sp.]|nr:hypothetical protein [Candidatus Limiplasma sp.]HPS80392.1 hypothetical protein [Candidatus Limiplasma sp.]